VADTSPIHYLVLTGAVGALMRLYSPVILPQMVAEELEEQALRMPSEPASLSRRSGVRSGPARPLSVH